MLTEKDYCDYDTCVALKELGYNRGAYAYYVPNHKEDLIFNTHQMRGCSINELVKGYNTYPSDVMGHELIDAPTMWEAQQWLRERKKLHVEVSIFANNYDVEIISTKGDKHGYHNVFIEKCGFKSYKEALSEGIKEAVKILKESNMEECKCKPAKSLAERVIDYKKFIELVRKMREAQVKLYEPYVDVGWWADRAIQLSKEVDEYLKKMEYEGNGNR